MDFQLIDSRDKELLVENIATQIASFAAVDSWCNLAWAAVYGKQRGQSNIARQVNRSPSQCHELIIRFKFQDLVGVINILIFKKTCISEVSKPPRGVFSASTDHPGAF